MNDIGYVQLSSVDPTELLNIVNDESVRTHLIDHPLFTPETLESWVNDKAQLDSLAGCCVRAVLANDTLAGWCGIQPDEDGFELAIVISKAHWGLGLKVFRDMMRWAQEMGHTEVIFHLLDSRRRYRTLEKMAKEVRGSERMGRKFCTYLLSTGN